jgi:hypothetical protein
MNRRAFLGSLIGGLAAGAAVRSWPFRVFSFPTEIRLAQSPYAQGMLGRRFGFDWYFQEEFLVDFKVSAFPQSLPPGVNIIESHVHFSDLPPGKETCRISI